jgi:pilus assembly protein CpaB
MNWKTWVPLCAAILMGIFAAKIGRDVLARGHKDAAPAAPKMVAVVVTNDDVVAGASLKDSDVSVVQMPPAAVPAQAFTNPTDVINRVALTRFVKGQPILDSMLLPAGSPRGLQGRIPEGMRAVTFEVNEVSGVAGLLLPGARVDIVMTFIASSGNTSEPEARTVAQDLQLIAVGRKIISGGVDDDQQSARSVTLLATPHEAELIELATHVGHPRLVLRSPTDLAMVPSKGVSIAELREMNGDRHDLAAAVPPPPVQIAPTPASKPTERVVQIIRNGTESAMRFEITTPPVITPPSSSSLPATSNTAANDTSPVIRGN